MKRMSYGMSRGAMVLVPLAVAISGCASSGTSVPPAARERAAVHVTFESCARELLRDRRHCSEVFPKDAQALGVCNEGAALRFNNCIDETLIE